MNLRVGLLLMLAAALAACGSHPKPYSTTVGLLAPGSTMTIRTAGDLLNVYKPLDGDPKNRFTVTATALTTATQPPAPSIMPGRGGIVVNAPSRLASLLVRVPDGVTLIVQGGSGDIHVTNTTGPVSVTNGHGNVQIIVPNYAQASTIDGGISVTTGSTTWPGTLHFSTQRGDIEVWINETAQFHAHLRTANGTLFTDFNLRGSAQGTAETIDGDVNGGNQRGIDIETGAGTIRLLKLHPES